MSDVRFLVFDWKHFFFVAAAALQVDTVNIRQVEEEEEVKIRLERKKEKKNYADNHTILCAQLIYIPLGNLPLLSNSSPILRLNE